ncbi:hypothetical protein F5I97DRAFT_1861373 [Phlebopus sp. FC_14]|nr:hypothetical protein F5I97DRAFT_1861373 [Phlebopus sp. FC_14]
MERHPRLPLQDLPLELYITQNPAKNSKSPRKHKRPLSPTRTTPYNPAKRRVLDAEGMPFASSLTSTPPALRPIPPLFHTATPTRPSRLGNGRTRASICSTSVIQTPHHKSVQSYSPAPSSSPQGTITPSSSRLSLFWDTHSTPTEISSVDRQSKHYPGFDVFQDPLRSPAAVVSLAEEVRDSEDGALEGESGKENVPPRRKAKRPSSKKRLSNVKGELGTLRNGEVDCAGRDRCADCPVPR